MKSEKRKVKFILFTLKKLLARLSRGVGYLSNKYEFGLPLLQINHFKMVFFFTLKCHDGCVARWLVKAVYVPIGSCFRLAFSLQQCSLQS